MARTTGFIQNNQNVTAFLAKLKKNSNQYPVLTKEQEKDLIRQYKDDPVKWRQLLILHNLRIVFAISKKYAGRTASYDDMVQRGMLGLSIAASRFDPDYDNKFATYATPWVFKYIVDEYYQRSTELDNNTFSLDEPYKIKNQETKATFEDYIEQVIDPTVDRKEYQDYLSACEELDIIDKIDNIVNEDTTLSALDRQIFEESFYKEKKPSQISVELQIPQVLVSQKKKKVVERIKEVLSQRYGIDSIDDIKLQRYDR